MLRAAVQLEGRQLRGADRCRGGITPESRSAPAAIPSRADAVEPVRGTTPSPAVASARRTLSPAVTHRLAWYSSRSTVAPANIFGMSWSKPAGWRLELTATLRSLGHGCSSVVRTQARPAHGSGELIYSSSSSSAAMGGVALGVSWL